MKPRVLYEIDPFNRLIVRRTGKGSSVRKFRQVVSGCFKRDKKNNLFYEVNKSSGMNIPQKIKFSGNYSLDKDHNLVFTLNKWNNQCEGNRLTFKTQIIDVQSNEITFLLNSKVSENKGLAYLLKLYGSWQADKNNRLTFGVEKDRDRVDRLILFGAWEVDKNNQITYKCGNNSSVLKFKGHWDIKDKYRLSYILDKEIDSGFDFSVSFGKVAPEGKDNYVIFDIAIARAENKRLHRKVVFSGIWRISKDKELLLEISPDKEKSLALKFTKDLFGQKGLAYIESAVKAKERFVGGGVAFRW